MCNYKCIYIMLLSHLCVTNVMCIVLCVCVLQATIGIDFLSKTMYLEDRTVSSFISLWFLRSGEVRENSRVRES